MLVEAYTAFELAYVHITVSIAGLVLSILLNKISWQRLMALSEPLIQEADLHIKKLESEAPDVR